LVRGSGAGAVGRVSGGGDTAVRLGNPSGSRARDAPGIEGGPLPEGPGGGKLFASGGCETKGLFSLLSFGSKSR